MKIKKGEGKETVKRLQEDLHTRLNDLDEIDLWALEKPANKKHKDRFDLCYEVNLDSFDYTVIIELDVCRADQVSKKFVSRTSHTLDKPTIYFAFCYPGTKHMAFAECLIYMEFCDVISNRLSSATIPREFIGILMQKKLKAKRKAGTKRKFKAVVDIAKA